MECVCHHRVGADRRLLSHPSAGLDESWSFIVSRLSGNALHKKRVSCTLRRLSLRVRLLNRQIQLN